MLFMAETSAVSFHFHLETPLNFISLNPVIPQGSLMAWPSLTGREGWLMPHRGIKSPHNGAEMRIWVEKNVDHREKRERREEINYYGIKSKGI